MKYQSISSGYDAGVVCAVCWLLCLRISEKGRGKPAAVGAVAVQEREKTEGQQPEGAEK